MKSSGFDLARLYSMQEPLSVRVEKIKGSTSQPIVLPPKAWTRAEIQGLENWLLTEWSGGGCYRAAVVDACGVEMTWDFLYDLRLFPERMPPLVVSAAPQVPQVVAVPQQPLMPPQRPMWPGWTPPWMPPAPLLTSPAPQASADAGLIKSLVEALRHTMQTPQPAVLRDYRTALDMLERNLITPREVADLVQRFQRATKAPPTPPKATAPAALPKPAAQAPAKPAEPAAPTGPAIPTTPVVAIPIKRRPKKLSNEQMRCRYVSNKSRCKAQSRGPRFHYLCEKHEGMKQ